MASRPKVLVVGGGKMGEAILAGWISSEAPPADQMTADGITVVEPDAARRAHLEETHGVSCVESVARAPEADLVVLAVKPQVMIGMLQQAAESGRALGAERETGRELIVSIAAGIATESLEAVLPAGAPVVRVMPNMPLMVGAGASAVCAGAHATQSHVELVRELFGCLGAAVVVEERDMDAVCALSGSGPAYVAAFVEALRDAAAAWGLAPALAETLALNTVLGTARLIGETDLTVAAAREAVCSPGGTTLAALAAFEESGFARAVVAGVDAAVRRSKELSQCTS